MMNLYFIAVEPQKELSDKIRAISKDFVNRFESEKAFKNFPHITIVPPFKFPDEEEEILIKNFAGIDLDTKVFEQRLNGFSAFMSKKNPVIYIQPENKEELNSLHNELTFFFVYSPPKGFHPHITVAYRDLTSENFDKAWSEYQHMPFRESFTVDKVGLYKYQTNKWKLIETLKLKED